ncbi:MULTISPECIES: hypothetical protein [unclassified Pseudodesulfovibrio]|jgi:hypothetical protein|uniref:hypothetical protein n=1 Tax=unclassified Pseudodesulfovibrio TaxID=2661612 RepID=UPI000FEBEC5E|nr:MULTISPECIES: hypothetical protein [unclassified Pseudodesulfovibrio]MCJ2166225.1 hypothetical protein [Pseudodesulfovibrio sp. S3-i]RWU02313.1 hypothetical protein DWB63_16835 [Pseudodesulfovibrio sp. S3]
MTKTVNYEDMPAHEVESRKQYMYDKMSPRRRKFVDRMGYENWDPFQAPFDPIDIRQDKTGFTSSQLSQLFIRDSGRHANQEFIDQVNEFNVMMVMNFEKVRPVYEFCLWYAEHCKKHGVEP